MIKEYRKAVLIERQDPDNLTRFQTRERWALEKAAYVFKDTTRSVTMNIFQKKNLFKSFAKVELSYVFTINMFSTAENCMEL